MIRPHAALGTVLAGFAGITLSGPGVASVSEMSGRSAGSSQSDFEARVEAIMAEKPVSLSLYYDDVKREGVFEPERIVTSPFSRVCKVSSSEIPRILQSLDLLRPIRDSEPASSNVNMALTLTNAAGKRSTIYFFYPVPIVPINVIFGGKPYRATSDFPKLIVKIARKNCGAHWPFPTDIGD